MSAIKAMVLSTFDNPEWVRQKTREYFAVLAPFQRSLAMRVSCYIPKIIYYPASGKTEYTYPPEYHEELNQFRKFAEELREQIFK